MKATKATGYSLIELAIVLMVIGIMIAGALKAQGLVQQAKSQALLAQVQQLRGAWYSFEDRFGSLPGDSNTAATLFSSTTAANGNGDGVVNTKAESGQAWFQLSTAGLIPGQFDGGEMEDANGLDCVASRCPENPYGGALRLGDFLGTDKTYLSLGLQVPPEAMARVDRLIDDGDAKTGDAILITDSGAACDKTWAEGAEGCALAIAFY